MNELIIHHAIREIISRDGVKGRRISSHNEIPQNSGGGKFWRIYHFESLAGKTLANCNELSLFSPVQ